MTGDLRLRPFEVKALVELFLDGDAQIKHSEAQLHIGQLSEMDLIQRYKVTSRGLAWLNESGLLTIRGR